MTTATATGIPSPTQITPNSADATPLIEPTDRSISPSISTHTIPSEITPITEQAKHRLTMLFGDRNTGLR